jgi:hypothetical protein
MFLVSTGFQQQFNGEGRRWAIPYATSLVSVKGTFDTQSQVPCQRKDQQRMVCHRGVESNHWNRAPVAVTALRVFTSPHRNDLAGCLDL